MHGDRKREAQPHSRTVGPKRAVDRVFQFGKGDDGIKSALDFLARKAGDHAVDKDVLAPGQVMMETRAKLQQGADLALHIDLARIRPSYAADEAQQGRLARAVAADEAGRAAALDGKRHILQCPELIERAHFAKTRHDGFLKGCRAVGMIAAQTLAHAPDGDGVAH